MFKIVVLSLGLGVGWTAPACRPPEVQAMENRVDHGEIISVLEISRTSLPGGPEQSLEASFHIQRSTAQPLDITFRSGQQYDFIIEEVDGTERWRWSQGRFFTQALITRTLADDPFVYQEKIPTTDQVGNPLAPGTYILWARLMTVDYEVENSVEFQIEP